MISLKKTVNNYYFCSMILRHKRCYSKRSKVFDANYQYIQRSKVPTMHFQKSLPRLPVPELQKTGERYLNALKPILSKGQFAEAEGRTKDYVESSGKILQENLIKKDKSSKHTSYISEYWFDLYLRDRAALPINYNPLIVFQNDLKPAYNNQLVRAANIVISSARFLSSLREQILEPEVYHMNPKKSNTPLFRTVTGLLPETLSWYGAYLFKAFPLDMSQFEGLFGATRIPNLDKDRILRDPTSKHIVVQKNGNFYTFDLFDVNGNLLSPGEILGNLTKIVNDATPFNDYPVGVLTCQNRDTWAKQRDYLEATGNKNVLHKIDTGILNLVLDKEVLNDDKHQILKHFLHGDGLNRWFDKSISVIITNDGYSGVNFEHSWGDGVAVLRFFEDIYKETTTQPFVHPDTKPLDSNITVTKLEFTLDDTSKEFVAKAKKEYKEWCDTLSIDYILYEGLNKEDCKKLKVSPDCIMQLGFQAAYHLLYGKYVGTYESCSTSAFKHGRTETMRPCTVKTKQFCDSLHSNSCSKEELRAMLTECSMGHMQLIKEAAMGQGFDRHMFALKKIAEENNLHVPELYDSHEYKFLNKSILSTSTLSSPSVLAGGFGPVDKNGFGVGYSAFPDKLGAAVTSYKPYNDSSKFIEALHKSFLDITKILSN
ncbi:hypothetical protein evm_012563 [Chilo suppressalis]|nr:hypothetical protein evm_012563 [Chilo suppressalis]